MKHRAPETDNIPDNPGAHAPGAPIVAVIGDGQLARMMQTAAIELGQSLRLLAGSDDSSAAQVCADVQIGDYLNLEDLRRASRGVDAVTFDHEHVPNEHLDALIADGINVQPQPSALIYAQDKLVQRRRLAEMGLPVPPFEEITTTSEGRAFFDAMDGQVCLKARRGGYDGHGVWFPKDAADNERLVEELLAQDVPLMGEQKVPFDRELSAMVARSVSGEVATWPVVESVQQDGICHTAIAPAPNLDEDLAARTEKLAVAVAEELGVTGVLAVELFQTTNDDGSKEVWVNELAMRPHNTGHWSQDGCVTDQFEQHLRAVLDLPLGSTATRAPVTVMVNTLGAETEPELSLGDRLAAVGARFPEVKIHLYGKSFRPSRKLGHVNLTGTDVARVRREAELAAHFIVHGRWADGYTSLPTSTNSTAEGEKHHD